MPLLHVQLLGKFHLSHDSMAIDLNSSRQQSLLTYLLLHRDESLLRQQVSFALLPDSSERQGRTNLRRELHHLRRALPEADRFLHVDNQRLQWHSAAPFRLDVAEFEYARARADRASAAGDIDAEHGALKEAADIYTGDLLPGCYDDWIQPERDRLAQSYIQTLERLSDLLEKTRAYQSAIEYAQRLLRHDALCEATYRRLMRLHALGGDRARALRVYHNCVTTLRRELDVEPDPATRKAHERLLQVDEAPSQPATTPPPTSFAAEIHLIGRQPEWATLQSTWQSAAQGRAHFAVVVGEAGIGKTRLVEELTGWAVRQGIASARTRSFAAEGLLVYAPVIEWLRTDTLRAELPRLDDVWLTEISRLLPELRSERSNLPQPQPLSESWQRQNLFEALTQAVLLNDAPLLLVIDDLQWTDRETLEWLHYLLRSHPHAPLLIAGTVRPEEIDADHPLTSLQRSLRQAEQLTEIELEPLDAVETTALAASLAGRELDAAEAVQLYTQTEGNPLFVVETMRAADGAIAGKNPAALPPQVQAVIEARLAQLSTPARRLVDLAATIGRSFSFDVLMQASDAREDALVRELDELWQHRIIRGQDELYYDFSHDKIRDVAYATLSTVNQHRLHRRVAAALEHLHADDLDPVSNQIAEHYARAGSVAQAIAYYQRAGNVAQRIYAHAEAARLFSKELALLETLPDSPARAKQELALRLALATSIRITKGFAAPELQPLLRPAQALCEQLGNAAQLPHVLYGLFTFHFVRANLHEVYALGEQLLALAEASQDATCFSQAHHALGASLNGLGQFTRARDHLTQSIAFYAPSQHRAYVAVFGADLSVFCQAWLTHPLWQLGHPDQALQNAQEALALAETLDHPFSHAIALSYAAMLHQFLREHEATRALAAAALAICQKQGIRYYGAWAAMLHGWARAQDGAIEEGIDELRHNLTEFQASGSAVRVPYYLSLLAELHLQAGDVEAGLACLDKALAAAQKTDERWWHAELYRLRGELTLLAGDEAAAEACFEQALDIARQQDTRTLELRAVLSLCRLWQQQDKRTPAHACLHKIYGWFSEGFDTPDLQEARMLLESLA